MEPIKAFLPKHALRSVCTAFSVGIFALLFLICDLALSFGVLSLLQKGDIVRIQYWHFSFRFFFFVLEGLCVAGFFAPSFPKESRAGRLFSRLKVLFCSLDYWFWCLCILVLVFLLPKGLGFLPMLEQQSYPDSLLIRLLLALLSVLFSTLAILWGGGLHPSEKQQHPAVLLVGMLLKGMGIAGISIATSYLFPTLWAACSQIGTVAAVLPLSFLLWLVVALVLLRLLRILLMRRKIKGFLKKLKKLCGEKHFTLSDEKTDFFRLVWGKAYAGFSLQAGEKCYSCRICAAAYRSVPSVFERNGKGKRVFTFRLGAVSLFTLRKSFSYEIKGQGEKILILCPCPKVIYVTKENGSLTLADNGEEPLDRSCRLYTGTAFLNLLDRSLD